MLWLVEQSLSSGQSWAGDVAVPWGSRVVSPESPCRVRGVGIRPCSKGHSHLTLTDMQNKDLGAHKALCVGLRPCPQWSADAGEWTKHQGSWSGARKLGEYA